MGHQPDEESDFGIPMSEVEAVDARINKLSQLLKDFSDDEVRRLFAIFAFMHDDDETLKTPEFQARQQQIFYMALTFKNADQMSEARQAAMQTDTDE